MRTCIMPKIYFINQIGDLYGNKCDNAVYAITGDKKIAKKFIQTRRKDIFELEKYECDHDEYYRTLDKFSSKVLFEEQLKTRSEFSGTRIIKFPMTEEETMMVVAMSERVWQELGELTSTLTFILNDESLRSLNEFGYFDAMSHSESYYENRSHFNGFFANIKESGERFREEFVIDEFELFLRYYGWTMIKKKEIN